MSTMTKVFVVLTAVLSIVASVLFISASAQWANYRALAETYLVQRDAAQTERDNAVATMEAALAMKDDALRSAEAQLRDERQRTQTLTDDLTEKQSDLVRVRNDKVAAETGRTKLQEMLGIVTGEVAGLREQNHALVMDKIKNRDQITALNARVLELTADSTILREQVRNLQEKLFASEQSIADMQAHLSAGGRPAVSEATTVALPTVAGPIRGEVAAVEGSYASVNIGASSGVVPGMTMMIYRGGSFLGELTISEVQPAEAGGRLRTLQGEIRPGDRVSYDQS